MFRFLRYANALQHRLLFEIHALEICEMFVYKHTETIDYVKKVAYFLRKYKIIQVVLGLRMQNFEGIVFT